MIRKIVSNGRAGVSRGALDAAVALDIPHGGWAFPGDAAGKDPIPKEYHLQEMKARSITGCMERNVKDSDGTLILTLSDDMPDDALSARKSAEKHHLPWLLVNIDQTGTFQAAQTIHEWLKEKDIRTLHVVGSSCGNSEKKACTITRSLLEAVYYLGLIENNMTTMSRIDGDDKTRPPKSVDEIVSRLSTEMSLKDRVIVANMKETQLELLRPTLGRHILILLEKWRNLLGPHFALEEIEKETADTDDLSFLIIQKLWENLRKTHRLRIV